MARVGLRSVAKMFGAVNVVNGVDLDIADGEFIVFVGPSGCGKSTLLRMIAGLEATTEGHIRIGDRDVTNEDPARRGIAMVFQTYALYPHMTVAANIGFPLEMARHPRHAIERKVTEAARILQLEPYLSRKPRELSGGQRQRVAIGRAIVREPGVFLFDEPLSNLDAELRVDMRLEIARLHQQLGTTTIYVTHDQVEAMTLAHRIVVLRAGRVEQVGTPMQLYEDPDNSFVAGFIGSPRINFVRAEVSEVRGNLVTLEAPEVGLRAFQVKSRMQSLAVGMKVDVGARPEHFLDRADTASPSIEATVTLVEKLGSVSYVHAMPKVGSSIAVQMKDTSGMNPGTVCAVPIDPDRALLFDLEGRRL